MKNIEKCTNTKDALDAFREWYKDHKHSVLTMSGWLEKEYDYHPQIALLEAAEDALKAWDNRDEYGNLEWVKDRMRQLSVAIKREKAKPIRNFDKYKTAKEAFDGFREMCSCHSLNECNDCRFVNSYDSGPCVFAYLYAEAKKGVDE